MTEIAKDSRWLALDGAFNVRDLGGYDAQDGSTLWKRFLRGDSLTRLTEDDQRKLVDYGVTTVIDLRHASELQASPNVFSGSAQVNYLHIPVIRTELPGTGITVPDLSAVYRMFVDDCQDGLRETLVAIADAPEGAVLFHCTAGKDRTGVVAALLLRLAGVSPETVAEDYALTTEAMIRMRAFIMAGAGDEAVSVTAEEQARRAAVEALLASDAPLMSALLAYIDEKYGDVEGYLHTIGLTHVHLQQLRQRFVALT